MEIICQIGLFEQARKLREEVFVKEQGFDFEFEERESICKHVVIMDNDIPVAVGRLYGQEETGIIGRIAVSKQYRGQNYGQQMMAYLESVAKKDKYQKIKLSAQVQAKEFYKKQGYQEVGEEYLDEHCPHIEMIKEL